MLVDELEEALDDLLPAGWSSFINAKGELIIRTNCRKDDEGELVSLDEEDDDEPAFTDDDTVPLEDEDDED
jgi:hypothetical protein